VPEENDQRSPSDDAWRPQLLIDSVVDYAIYMIDLDGRVASWNPGAARLKGYSAEEIVGQPFAKFFTPEDQAREFPQQALAAAARTGGSSPKAGGCAPMVAGSGRWRLSMPCAITTASSLASRR
jgi:PAS domain-containing protein